LNFAMASWVLQNAAQGPKPHPRSRHCGTALGASGRPLVVKGQPEPRRAACVVLPLLPLLASRFRHRPAQGPGFRRLRRRATAAPSDDSRVYAFSSVDGLWPKSPAAADLGFFVGLQGSDQDFVVVEPADAGDAACNWRERLLQLGLFPDGGLPQVVGLQQALDWRLSAQNWVPWTWSRRVFQELGDSEAAKNCESWHQTHGKSWAAQRCYEWHEEFASELEERFGQQSSGGQAICSTEEEAKEVISRILEEGWDGVFVKAEHGWAGQGNKRLRRGDTEAAKRNFSRWLTRRLREGPVIVEPECARLFDFSVQLDVGAEGTEIASRNIFLCDGRGAFLGAELGENVWRDTWVCALGHNTARASASSDASDLAEFTAETLAEIVGGSLRSSGYRGPCGVDGFVYRHPHTGLPILRPISDVNPRQTITRIAEVAKMRLPEEILGVAPSLQIVPQYGLPTSQSCTARRGLLRVLPLTPLGEAPRPGLAALLVTGIAQRAHAASKGNGRTSKASLDIRHFAEGLLFRGSLEQKLQHPPQELFDALKGPKAPTVSPAKPAQALDLAWPERSNDIAICRGLKGGSDQLPKMGKILASAEARVQCLQKFANHELQAIEMFAWALLRFPDAPRGLQRGLLKTIREEQSHCRLYLDRVAALAPRSAPLGPAPLSGYLWRSLESLNSAPEPLLAFLCGIGLTFEAANLDHSLRYRDIFRQAGDEDSAAVLQRVHDEEVEHVRLAHVWLHRLAKEKGLGELDDLALYDRFAAKPVFALCKARGRGFPAAAARRKAGFSEALITAVREAKSQRRPLPVEPASC